MSKLEGLIINGWSIFAHPVFLNQLDFLIKDVEKLLQKDLLLYKKKNSTKRLAAISRLIFEIIPNNPALPEYRQANTLGPDFTHWHRAKFFQQYRLFFRYHLDSKIIVYAWVNDEDTKRAYESKYDAYLTFAKMLKKGSPPDDWSMLLAESQQNEANKTLNGIKQLSSPPIK